MPDIYMHTWKFTDISPQPPPRKKASLHAAKRALQTRWEAERKEREPAPEIQPAATPAPRVEGERVARAFIEELRKLGTEI